MIDFLVYLFSGRILLFLAKKFPPIRDLGVKSEFFRELLSCNICSGTWVYLFLIPWFRNIDIDDIKFKPVKWLVIAGVSSILSQCIVTGYEELFGTVVIVDGPGETA